MDLKLVVFLMTTVVGLVVVEGGRKEVRKRLNRAKRCTWSEKLYGKCDPEKEQKDAKDTAQLETSLSHFSHSESFPMVSSSSSDVSQSNPTCHPSNPDCPSSSPSFSTNPFLAHSKGNYDYSYAHNTHIIIIPKNQDTNIYVLFNEAKIPISFEQFMKIFSLSPTPHPTISSTTPTTTTPFPIPSTTITTPLLLELLISTTQFATTEEVTTEEFISTTTTTTTTTTTSPTTTTTTEPLGAQLHRELKKGISWYQSDVKWAVVVGGVAAGLTILLLLITILTIRAIIAHKQTKRLNEYQRSRVPQETSTYKDPYGYPPYV